MEITVQVVLPLMEMTGWLRKGAGELKRHAGLQALVQTAPVTDHGRMRGSVRCLVHKSKTADPKMGRYQPVALPTSRGKHWQKLEAVSEPRNTSLPQ